MLFMVNPYLLKWFLLNIGYFKINILKNFTSLTNQASPYFLSGDN